MPLRDLTRDAALRIPRVKAFHAHTHALAAERDGLAAERDRLAAERDALHARAEAAEARVAELSGRVSRLERELESAGSASEARAEALRRQLRAFESEVTSGRAEVEVERARALAAIAVGERLSGELAALNETAVAERADFDRLTARFEQMQVQASYLQGERHRALGRIEDLVEALKANEEHTLALKGELGAERDALESELVRERESALQREQAWTAEHGLLAAELVREREGALQREQAWTAERGLLAAELVREREGALQREQAWTAERELLAAELSSLRLEVERAELSAAAAAEGERAAAAQLVELRIQEAVLRSELAGAAGQAAELASVRAEANALRERVGSAEYEVGLLREAAKSGVDPADMEELRTRAELLQGEARLLRNEERRLGQARLSIHELRTKAGATPPKAMRPPSEAEVLQYFDVLLPSKAAGYMYAFVPKAACTSAKAALWRAEAALSPSVGPLANAKAVHARSHDPDSPWQTAPFRSAFHGLLDELVQQRALMLTLVRNPFSRIFSA